MSNQENTKKIEIELKFPLLEKNILVHELNKKAKLLIKDQLQKDTYYSPIKNDFLIKNPVSEWLRVRETDNKITINFKRWHNENNKQTIKCDEYETTVRDSIIMKNILMSLKFKQIAVVDKKRTTWQYKKAELSIDEVKDLGDFLEVESIGDFESEEEAESYLFEIIEELEVLVGEQDYEGYPYKILKKNGLLSN